MAYVTPSTVVAGQTYSAASHNIIVNDIIDHEDRLDTVQNAQYPARNVLVNGAMQFSQRGTSVSGISSGLGVYYTADRWNTYVNNAGTHTHAISADAPAGSGFRNSYRVTCATAITSLSSNAIQILRQRLEGQTLQHIKKGTASAQQLTASFWVKGSTTGTYIVALEDNDNTRYVASSYTISAANTWEQKTVTFPADTTGVLDNDNAASLDFLFWLVAGSQFTSGTLATTWAAASDANKAVGQTNLAAAVNNYIQITGVQLEPGSQASPFEFVRYDDELRRCQRYFQKSYNVNVTPGTVTTDGEVRYIAAGTGGEAGATVYYAVPLRIAASTLTFYSPATGTASRRRDYTAGADDTVTSTNTNGERGFSGNASHTTGRIYGFHYTASAEL